MSKKRWAMYVHAWDIIDEGIDKTLQFLSNNGIDMVNIASSYHTGRYILPHNPKRRVYIAEEGVVYFKPNNAYFKNLRIKPRQSKNYRDHDVLKELSEVADSYNMKISSWTVFFHNRAFVNKYPDLAIVDPFGNRDGNFLCPNKRETRDYMAALAANIADYGIKTIQMESWGYPTGLMHGNHHETFGVKIDPTVSFLFSMCYCNECKRKALDIGLNLDEKLLTIKKLIDENLNSENICYNGVHPEEKIIQDLEKFHLEKLLELKQSTTEEILINIREKLNYIDQNINIETIVNAESYLNEGLSFGNIPNDVSGIDMITYYPDLNTIVSKVEWAINLLKNKTQLFPSIRITYPMIQDNEQIKTTIEILERSSIQGINFYNYGWATEKRLKQLFYSLKGLS